MKDFLIAFILLGQLVLLLFADFDKHFWISFYWIWHKTVLVFAMLIIRNNMTHKPYANVFLLLALFFLFMLLWEVLVSFYPTIENSERWARIIFSVLIIIVSCITYLPFIKRIWQKLS